MPAPSMVQSGSTGFASSTSKKQDKVNRYNPNKCKCYRLASCATDLKATLAVRLFVQIIVGQNAADISAIVVCIAALSSRLIHAIV